jgi:hypothetical protein
VREPAGDLAQPALRTERSQPDGRAIIVAWRVSGDFGELAEWCRPIEAALEATSGVAGGSARLRAAIAHAAEDDAEARFMETPCPETARVLRRRATDRLASLEHDREIASRFGVEL